MRIESANFVTSAMEASGLPKDGRPEIAFVGRSNVGKSTLLNALLHRNGLAKTSNRPGKTQTINFFEVNQKIYLVDLPGYGFAKVPKTTKAQWNRHMMEYLRQRETLCMVAALIDSRIGPTDKDIHMLRLLEESQKPTLIVATKIDKLKRGERKAHLDKICKVLNLDEEAVVIPFSGVTGEGVRELWSIIGDAVSGG